MYRYRKYGIKPLPSSSLLTAAQIRLYRKQAEQIDKELEPHKMSNLSIDELITKGPEQMKKNNFKIAVGAVKDL